MKSFVLFYADFYDRFVGCYVPFTSKRKLHQFLKIASEHGFKLCESDKELVSERNNRYWDPKKETLYIRIGNHAAYSGNMRMNTDDSFYKKYGFVRREL